MARTTYLVPNTSEEYFIEVLKSLGYRPRKGASRSKYYYNGNTKVMLHPKKKIGEVYPVVKSHDPNLDNVVCFEFTEEKSKADIINPHSKAWFSDNAEETLRKIIEEVSP